MRAGAARRRRLRALGGALALAAVVGVGSALAAVLPGSAPSSQALRAGSGTLSCPAAVPSSGKMPSGHPGTDRILVPDSPVEGVVCTFKVTRPPDPGTTAYSLLGTRMLVGSPLQVVVSALQKPVSPYTFPCMFASQFYMAYLEFRYASGPDVAVQCSRQCPGISNGTLNGAFDRQGILPPG